MRKIKIRMIITKKSKKNLNLSLKSSLMNLIT